MRIVEADSAYVFIEQNCPEGLFYKSNKIWFSVDAILQAFSLILRGGASNKMAYNYPAMGNPPLPPGAMSKRNLLS